MIFILLFAIPVLFIGCHEAQTQSNEVLKAWSGEFSEEKLKSAIHAYQTEYTDIVLEKDAVSSVSFETDFKASSCSVIRLSRADDTDADVELSGYIDLWIQTDCNGKTVTVPIDWWYTNGNGQNNDCFVWSYLVCVKDVYGRSHYYYFRVDYSACAQ